MDSAQVRQAAFGTASLPDAAADDSVQKEGQDFPLVIATMPETSRHRTIAVGIVIQRGDWTKYLRLAATPFNNQAEFPLTSGGLATTHYFFLAPENADSITSPIGCHVRPSNWTSRTCLIGL
jgi:hypothetical protein